MTSTISADGDRFVHLLNLDGFDKTVRLTDGGHDLLPGCSLTLRRRDALLLPCNVAAGPARILRSTAELAAVGDDALSFRLTQPADAIALETNKTVAPHENYEIERRGQAWIVTSRRRACGGANEDELMTVRFE